MTKILIVDDNGSIRRILTEILETRNYAHRVRRVWKSSRKKILI